MVSVLAGMVHIRMHTYATNAARNVQIQKWQKQTMSRLMMVTILETYTQDCMYTVLEKYCTGSIHAENDYLICSMNPVITV